MVAWTDEVANVGANVDVALMMDVHVDVLAWMMESVVVAAVVAAVVELLAVELMAC